MTRMTTVRVVLTVGGLAMSLGLPLGAAGEVPQLKEASFRQEVLLSPQPVLLFFTANWCGACRREIPQLEQLARDHAASARVFRVDVDTGCLATLYDVKSLPAVILFRDGAERRRLTGPEISAQALEQLLGGPGAPHRPMPRPPR